MKSFLTRIELHNLPSTDWHAVYGQLHKEMAARLFHTSITGDNGITYNLPSATYRSNAEDHLTSVNVRDIATAAINATKQWAMLNGKNSTFTHSILTVEYASGAWIGLKA